MQRWRLAVLAALVAGPVLVLIGLGMHELWWTGWSFWFWWPMAGSFALATFLAWRWQSQRRLLPYDDVPPLHWTDRDREAWQLVEAHAKRIADLKSDQLTSLTFFEETAKALANELARFYHPSAADPVSALTIPEILAVVELASHDLAEMVDQYLPGGHLLTINDLRRMKQIADWYPTASKVSWLISSVFSPVNTAVRYFATQTGMNRPWRMLQENVLVWFCTAYVHRMGRYLIDLNSGRLRVGATRYRALHEAHLRGDDAEREPADAVPTVTLALVGQTKAGKSSLINALLGEQRAVTDVLPATADIQPYELQPGDIPTRVRLLDTVGYGSGRLREDQQRATERAARQADVVLLVLHARDPARQADLEMLKNLQAYFVNHRDLRKPPVLAVLTHIDLLAPSLEWSPPYTWQDPKRPKELQMQQAVAAVGEQLGSFLAGVIPVCTAPEKIYGVQQWLLPAIVGLLDQAHAVAFLRCLKGEIDTGKIKKVFNQLVAASKGLLPVLWRGKEATSGPPSTSSSH